MVYDISVFYRLGPEEHVTENITPEQRFTQISAYILVLMCMLCLLCSMQPDTLLKYTLYGPDRLFAHAHKHATRTYE